MYICFKSPGPLIVKVSSHLYPLYAMEQLFLMHLLIRIVFKSPWAVPAHSPPYSSILDVIIHAFCVDLHDQGVL